MSRTEVDLVSMKNLRLCPFLKGKIETDTCC